MLKIEEPAITIHGQPLTTGQAMTVRVALQSFATSLQEDGLGRDQHGLEMTEAYLARIREINLLMKIQ
jgi:hypothetical protein